MQEIIRYIFDIEYEGKARMMFFRSQVTALLIISQKQSQVLEAAGHFGYYGLSSFFNAFAKKLATTQVRLNKTLFERIQIILLFK